MEERLQKILSQWGIASRRQAEALIVAGRVRRNGVIASIGTKANIQLDEISVDGKLIHPQFRPQLVYLLLNKPKGVVSTCDDPQGRKTIIDLLPKNLQIGAGIHPVGRLDADSSGALILTNDGELTFLLTHPRHSIPKTYHVWVKGHPPEAVLQHWRQGVILEGRKTRTCPVRVIARGKTSEQTTCLEIILKEGRNRQIRRIADQLKYPVVALHRTNIGTIQLQSKETPLPQGSYRYLEEAEICLLRRSVSIASVEEPDAF